MCSSALGWHHKIVKSGGETCPAETTQTTLTVGKVWLSWDVWGGCAARVLYRGQGDLSQMRRAPPMLVTIRISSVLSSAGSWALPARQSPPPPQ